ncbi:MAG: hypothetical protein EBY49_05700, partial [Actinobacteria bacterium]|nr:hypothetical protein [Actinomycetota bacterium]
ESAEVARVHQERREQRAEALGTLAESVVRVVVWGFAILTALGTVGIDLASGYRLVRLTISPDGACRFPVDVTSQVRHVEGLQQYLFTPNPGQLVEQLAADDNCAIATFEEIANPGTTQQIDWTFTVS